MRANQLEKKLRDAGWICVSRRGHHKWRSSDGRVIEVRRGGRWSEQPRWLVTKAGMTVGHH